MNEEALKGHDNCFEPFMESVFNFKYGNKVEITDDFIRVTLEDREIPRVPMYSSSLFSRYIVDRFRSFGDQRFYQIANSLEKLDHFIE